jgi:hypothetical protein
VEWFVGELAHQILEHHGNSGEGCRRIDCSRFGSSSLVAAMDHCVQGRVPSVDAGQRQVDELGWRHITITHQRSLPSGVEIEWAVGGCHAVVLAVYLSTVNRKTATTNPNS